MHKREHATGSEANTKMCACDIGGVCLGGVIIGFNICPKWEFTAFIEVKFDAGHNGERTQVGVDARLWLEGI